MADYRSYVQQLNRIAEIRSAKDLPRISVFHGESEYFLSRTTKFYRKCWKEISDGEIVQHEMETFDQERRDGGFHQSSLFSPTTLHCFSVTDPKNAIAIIDLVKDGDPNSFYCLQILKGELAKGIASKLQGAMVLTCVPPMKAEMPAFVQALTRRFGITLEGTAIELLLNEVGDDFAALENEVSKLSLVFPDRNEPKLKSNEIASVIGALREDHAFKLSDLILENRIPEATTLIHELIERGESSLAVLGLLSRHTRVLALSLPRAQSSGLDARGRLPGWLKTKYDRLAGQYSAETIQSLFYQLSKVDIQLKSSPFDDRLLLSSYLMGLR